MYHDLMNTIRKQDRGRNMPIFLSKKCTPRIPFVRYGMWLFALTAAFSFVLTYFYLVRSESNREKGIHRIRGVVVDPGLPIPETMKENNLKIGDKTEGFLSSVEKVPSDTTERALYQRGKYQKIRLKGGSLVMLYLKAPARRGDIVNGYAELRVASSPRNPGALSKRLWLWSNGASRSGHLISGSFQRQDHWYHRVARFPDKMRTFIYQQCVYLFESSEGAVTASLTLGDTRLFSDKENYFFRASGIAHLTSVSGSHLYFFLLPIRYIVRSCARSSKRERIILRSVIWIPGLLAGWGTGITRATIMQAVTWIDPHVRRRRDHVNAIGYIGSLLLILDPFSVWSRGFWMSITISGMILMTRSVSSLESSLQHSYYNPSCAWSCSVANEAKFCDRFSSVKSLLSHRIQMRTGIIADYLKMVSVAALTALPYQAMSSFGLFLGIPFVNVIAMIFAAWITITGYTSILLLSVLAPFPALVRKVSTYCAAVTAPAARCLLRIASIGARAYALYLPVISVLWIAAVALLAGALFYYFRQHSGGKAFYSRMTGSLSERSFRRHRYAESKTNEEFGRTRFQFFCDNTSLRKKDRRPSACSRGLYQCDRRVRVIISVLIIGSIVLFIRYGVLRRRQHVWRVLFADVGQGDATLLVSPKGYAFLIDGGDAGSGFQTLIPAMRYLGVHNIDVAMVTHGHQDHVAGVMELLSVDMVRHLVIGNGNRKSTNDTCISNPRIRSSVEEDVTDDLLNLAEKHGVSVTTVCEGDRLQLDDAVCLVLSASDPSSDINDASLVLKIHIDGIDLLFTGDITHKKERFLMEKGVDVQCQIIHVPHHGSRLSSTSAFLDVTKAQTAVISAGEGNRFGHPHQDTLSRLDDSGLFVFRTDLQGAIFLIIKERTGTITTWLEH